MSPRTTPDATARTTAAALPAPAALERVVDVVPGVEAIGVRAVPATLDVFGSHFPRFPVLPGVLLVQAMAQVAAVALGDADGWTLGRVEGVRFRHPVRPGDVVVVTARVADRGPHGALCAAKVTVEGRLVVTARRLQLVRADIPSQEGTSGGAPA